MALKDVQILNKRTNNINKYIVSSNCSNHLPKLLLKEKSQFLLLDGHSSIHTQCVCVCVCVCVCIYVCIYTHTQTIEYIRAQLYIYTMAYTHNIYNVYRI